jgi:hypothetical protein
LDTVFPSRGTYRVNALVDDAFTLDEYSIIDQNSRICPRIENSVVNDPDVKGLMIFVQDTSGTIVSRKIQYLLSVEGLERQAIVEEQELLGFSPSPKNTGINIPILDDFDIYKPIEPETAGGTAESPESPQGESSAFPDSGDTAGAAADPINNPSGIARSETKTEPESKIETGGTDTSEYPLSSGESPGNVSPPAVSPAVPIALPPIAPSATATGETPVTAPSATTTPATGVTSTTAPSATTTPATGEMSATAPSATTTTATVVTSAATTAAPRMVVSPETTPAPKTAAESSPAVELLKDQTLQIKQLDQNLPAFRIFEDLKIGQYTIVFQVLGKDEILYKTSKPVYFLGDAEFTLGEIQSYLPGKPSASRLIPPGINIILETKITADERLDPYIMWYSGKKIISQGRVSGGANYLLWKTPEQTGFHNIRAEVFPLAPESKIPSNIIGKIKELSLPISLKSEGLQYFTDVSEKFISWYQFWGNLEDTKMPHDSERHLIPLMSQKPWWVPYAGIYGLFVGPDDVYALPGKPFGLSEKEQGRGRILIHFVPLSEGSILNAVFNPMDPQDSKVTLDLFTEGENLTLRLSTEEEFSMASLFLNPETSGFITVFIDFEITPEHLGVRLALETPAMETDLMDLPLANPISGEGIIRFGDGERRGEHKRDIISPILDRNGNPGGAAILNELAFSYIREAFLKEDPETPDNKSEETPESAASRVPSIQALPTPVRTSAEEEPGVDLGGLTGETEPLAGSSTPAL